MAKQEINVGTTAGDNTGDGLRTSMIKCNSNFTELYDLHESKVGFFDYNDNATQTTPISVTGGAGYVDLTNDTLGAYTLKTYAPTGITDVYNSVTNKFDFSQLSVGDMVDIRLDVTVITSSVNTEITIDLEVGNNSYIVPFIPAINYKVAGTYNINRYNGIYIGNLDTLNNGAKFRIKSDENCTVKVNGWYCKITRR